MVEKKGADYFTRKISNTNSIDILSSLFKEFLKNSFGIKQGYTFEESTSIIVKKHIDEEIKATLIQICEKFSYLEYGTSNPPKKDIDYIKKSFSDIVKKVIPTIKEKAKGKIIKIRENVKKKSHAFKVKASKVKNAKQTISKKIEKNIHEKMDDYTEKELKHIVEFIKVCREMGTNRPRIRKELLEMGYEDETISIGFLREN